MCEFQTIRYVHVMQHRDCSAPLRCGCDCAGKMSGDCEAAEQRERLAKNFASRRARWLDRNWKTSVKGNAYLKTDGFLITVFSHDSRWKACVADSCVGQKTVFLSHLPYRRQSKTRCLRCYGPVQAEMATLAPHGRAAALAALCLDSATDIRSIQVKALLSKGASAVPKSS